MDTDNLTGLTFLDLKKAFNTVDHKISCKSLSVYRADANAMSLFSLIYKVNFRKPTYLRVEGSDM